MEKKGYLKVATPIEITMHQVEIYSVYKDRLKDLDLEDFLTVSFYIIDELYQSVKYIVKRAGPLPVFSDSETICLNLVGQMVCDSENGWYGLIKKNYSHLFPKLLERSRYHRRCKDLQQLTEVLRCKFLSLMDAYLQKWHILDSMPVPVCVYARASRNLRFTTDFGIDDVDLYGFCSAKKEKYYGFKLHFIVTTQGVPVHYLLAPSAHHDVVLAPELLATYQKNKLFLFDKGYIGLEKKIPAEEYELIIHKRENQQPNTPIEKAFLGKFRKTIETTFSVLTGQFHLQFTRAKSAWGLKSRVIAKVTALTFAIFLNFIAKQPLLNIKQFIFN